jgi:hypothetical protein
MLISEALEDELAKVLAKVSVSLATLVRVSILAVSRLTKVTSYVN